MATITTDTFLDDGTARTSNESWTLSNKATLTVRTDTRWHVGAPASMSGIIGGVSANSTTGGGYYIDGTKVRWMAYNTGSGNVPAIGTTITQGGVSGYLLGVWADYVSAPTAVGAAMPATGYIKFREVTGGQFAVGALTGIGASATEADRVGWIEVVHSQSTGVTIYNPGLGFKTLGDWFYLGTTTGTPGQTVQIPANGGGAATQVPGIQIETSPGSNLYTWYPCFIASGTTYGWSTSTLGTDVRGKAVQCITNGAGLIRIGSDGTSNVGYTPPSGCKIRIPNILLRQAATGTPAVNANSTSGSTRPRIFSTSGGKVDMQNILSDWNHTHTWATYFRIKDSCTEYFFNLTSLLAPAIIDNFCLGYCQSTGNTNAWATCTLGGTVNNSVFGMAQSAGPVNLSAGNEEFVFNNTVFLKASNRASTQALFSANSKATLNNCFFIGGYLNLNTGSSVICNNLDYIDRALGNTSSTGGQYLIQGSAGYCELNGLTFGFNNTLSECHPYSGLISTSSCTFILKNIGTYASPLPIGATDSTKMSRIWSGSADINCKIKRVFLSGLRSGFNLFNIGSTGNSKNILIENVYAANTTGVGLADLYGINTQIRSVRAATMGTNNINAIGSHFINFFTSDTVGELRMYGNQQSTLTASNVELGGTAEFTGGGAILFPVIGDYAVLETPWFVKGYTAFNSNPVSNNGSGSFTSQYQIDTGSGWNGTWKTLNATNLQTESISPSGGFKLKIKYTASGAYSSFTYSIIYMTTTAAAQSENLYPLSTATLAFTGLQAGSEVRCYQGTDPNTSVEIGGIESTAGSTFDFSHSSGGEAGYIMIFALGYQPLYIPYTFKTTDDSILIQQVIDRNYTNPA